MNVTEEYLVWALNQLALSSHNGGTLGFAESIVYSKAMNHLKDMKDAPKAHTTATDSTCPICGDHKTLECMPCVATGRKRSPLIGEPFTAHCKKEWCNHKKEPIFVLGKHYKLVISYLLEQEDRPDEEKDKLFMARNELGESSAILLHDYDNYFERTAFMADKKPVEVTTPPIDFTDKCPECG